jgi:tetratricopeptide (TPR) repeat protein
MGRTKAGIAVAVLLFATVASADREKARAAYKTGIQHYNLAEWQQALDSFKDAYREVEDPSLLFNIGQCHRQLGDRKQAITFYRAYLRELPNAENREEVKRLIATLEPGANTESPTKSESPKPVPAAPVVSSNATSPGPSLVASTPVAKPAKRSRAWIWGVVAGAAAVVAIGVGLGVGLSTSERDPTPTLGSVTKN